MPAEVKEWIPLGYEDNHFRYGETRVWYEEDGVYVGVINGPHACEQILLKGLEKTAGKTDVTFQYTGTATTELSCPAIVVTYVLIIKLPPTENVEVVLPSFN